MSKDLLSELRRAKYKIRKLTEELEEAQVQLSERPTVPMYNPAEEWQLIAFQQVESDRIFWRQLHNTWFYIKWRWQTRNASWRKEK